MSDLGVGGVYTGNGDTDSHHQPPERPSSDHLPVRPSSHHEQSTEPTCVQTDLPQEEQPKRGMIDKAFHYVMGTAPAINELLDGKLVILQMPNMFLRAYGAPIFINNPWAGLLIFIATLITPYHGLMGVLGLVSAILTSLMTSQSPSDVISGGCTFHGLLIGVTLAATSGGGDWYPWLVFPVTVLGVMSVYVSNALGTLLTRVEVPSLNLAFNVLTFAFLSAVGANHLWFPTAAAPALGPPPTNVSAALIVGAIPRSMSAIYGCEGWIPGLVILLAMGVASPALMMHALLGASVSVATAFALNVHPDLIYTGGMSYNGLLSCASLAGFFLVPSLHSHVLATCSAVFSTLWTIGMNNYFSKLDVPIVAFPFNLSTMLLLCVTSRGRSLTRVAPSELCCPELHWLRSRNTRVSPIA